MKTRLTIFAALLAGALFIHWQPAEALPAFARKYKTSCQTCHVAYPKLNAFGEAFRLNGFQIPENEEELTKDEALELGSEGWKRVWPDGVWPGAIPGTPPLAVRAETGFEYEKGSNAKTKFQQPTVELFLSGTMQEDISFYTGFHLFEEGEIGSLGRAYIQFSSLLSNWKLPKYLMSLRIGQFIPEAVPFANHRGLTLTPYVTSLYSPGQGSTLPGGHGHGGSGGFALESNQIGLEMRGIIKSRWRYATGILNGNAAATENNDAKDGYFRMAYKLGGIGFDGSGGGNSLSATTLVDNAITFGTFGYLGALKNLEPTGPNDLKIRRIGGDINLTYRSLNLFGAYMFGRDRVMLGTTARDLDFTSWFTEADYGIYPWLIGVVRYETANADGSIRGDRIVPHLTMLPRPNIKIVLESVVDPDNVALNSLVARLDFLF